MSPKLEKCPRQPVCGAEASLLAGTHLVPTEFPRGPPLEPQGQKHWGPRSQRRRSGPGQRAPTRGGSAHPARGRCGHDPGDAPPAFAAVGRPGAHGVAGRAGPGAPGSSGFADSRALGFPVCELGGDARPPPPTAARRRVEPRSAMHPRRRARFSGCRERAGDGDGRGRTGGAQSGISRQPRARPGAPGRANLPRRVLSPGRRGLLRGERDPSRARGRAGVWPSPGTPGAGPRGPRGGGRAGLTELATRRLVGRAAGRGPGAPGRRRSGSSPPRPAPPRPPPAPLQRRPAEPLSSPGRPPRCSTAQ